MPDPRMGHAGIGHDTGGSLGRAFFLGVHNSKGALVA